MSRLLVCLLCAGALIACKGFEPIADLGEPDLEPASDLGASEPRRDLRVPDRAPASCPPGIAAPVIESFTITDGLKQVALGQSASLAVKASGAAGQALAYRFSVAPPADAVISKGDGTAQWSLGTAKPVFFSTDFTITATVTHACGGPGASATVKLKVLGNVLVADRKHASIEAIGSGGQSLGQVAGAALLTSPGDLALLGATELAVADSTPKLVKVIDLSTGTVTRSFGSDAPGLTPDYLLRTSQGDLLVGFAKNLLFRYSPQGKLLSTITTPNPYGCAGLAELADGSIIVGTSGSGGLYRVTASGAAAGSFANVPTVSDTNSLLRTPTGELLMGARGSMNDGKVLRLSTLGAVMADVQPTPKHTFYFLRRFVDGYLFVHFFDSRIYRLDDALKVDTAPFATLSSESWLAGMVWLDGF